MEKHGTAGAASPEARTPRSRRPRLTAVEIASIEATRRSEFWGAPPDAELPREVTAIGAGYSVPTFEALAIRGGGPRYRKIGRRVLYKKADVLAWLESKSQIVDNTAQLAAASGGRLQGSAFADVVKRSPPSSTLQTAPIAKSEGSQAAMTESGRRSERPACRR